MILNSNEIQKILPHRYPFLMVDKITEIEEGKYARGIKCVSANEMHFLGHFPEKHVMPGVLIIEALAQVGAIAILIKEENKGKLAYFGGIRKARFKKQVVPGDVIDLYCQLIKIKGNIGIAEAVATVDGEIAVKAELTFAIDK